MQAADGACDVYIFDILQLEAEAFSSGLGAMLGSARALKLMFDARSDADALWHEWRVQLNGVFDLQVAHVLAFARCRYLTYLHCSQLDSGKSPCFNCRVKSCFSRSKSSKTNTHASFYCNDHDYTAP